MWVLPPLPRSHPQRYRQTPVTTSLPVPVLSAKLLAFQCTCCPNMLQLKWCKAQLVQTSGTTVRSQQVKAGSGH